MTQPAKIDPDAWYDEFTLSDLGFSSGVLAKARKAGELQHRRAGKHGRAIYLGQWLLDWLTGEPSAREVAEV